MAVKNAYETLFHEWQKVCKDFDNSYWMTRLKTGDFSIEHYKSYLTETYFHTGLNPQIQAVATVYFKDNPRAAIKKFYQHAIAEIGHDLMALNDLKALGVDVSAIPQSNPLPSTLALNAYPLFEIQYRNPVAYLGYLFHLECLPTQKGAEYIKSFKAVGVPDTAFSFLMEHATVDVHHIKMMKDYVEALVLTKADLDAVIYGAQVTCQLFGHMVFDAFERGERQLQMLENLDNQKIALQRAA